MNHELIAALSRYINDVLADFELTGDWPAAESLPLYLQGGYSYHCAHLSGHDCLLMLDKETQQQDTASRLKKYMGIVAQHFHGPVVYVVQDTTSYNRKHLIEQRIAFVVPGKQLYLPFAAIDLRESFNRAEFADNEPKSLGPVAQHIVLLALYGRWDTQQTAQSLAERLNVSKMTVSRAYSELVSADLARLESNGRTKSLVFSVKHRDLWLQAKPLLTNPIKNRVWVDEHDYRQHAGELGLLAGESALSELGMLMEPKNRSVAVPLQDWASLKKLLAIQELPQREAHSVAVELWKYDPRLLSERPVVDALSLVLSLESESDDRVDMAREQLLTDVFARDL